MPGPNWTTGFETHLRHILLGIAVLASVAVPYAIIRNNADDTLEASAWVVHSAEVQATLYELRFDLSELEGLVVSDFVAIPHGAARPGYEKVRERIAPLLQKLSDATRDNPDQQNRIGALKVLYNGRVSLLDAARAQIAEKNFDAAGESIRQAALIFGSRETATSIIDAEKALFVDRNKQMESARTTAKWTMSAALLAQLILLGSVIILLERQAHHRRVAEARARQATERSRMIVQTLREPIVVLDVSLNVVMANEAFIEFYGDPPGNPKGMRLDLQGDGAWDNPLLLQRLVDVATRGREIWDFELIQHSSDHIERVVLVNARRMDLSEDADLADRRTVLVTVSDVTARKRYEQRINELNEDLEAKVQQISVVNRELESFSYSVSHDLRAPLRHIAGFADKLGMHIAESADDRARHYLAVIGDAARRMSALIEDLLEYSRLGRSAFRSGPVNMNTLVAELRAMFQGNNDGREIEWRIGELPMVIGDESMLRRVWQNLISNAVKYTSRRAHARIEIGAQDSAAGEIVYYVKDNGTGFDMAYAGKLFGVFQRLHKASEFPGTGIGLANVRRIVSRLGGRTWADAKPDQGATVYFSLPAVSGALPAHVTEVIHES